MVTISDTDIFMTRGDTLLVQVSVTLDEEGYSPEDGDTIAFYLKRAAMNSKKTAYKDEQPIITKKIPVDTMILELEPDDTKPLEFGDYVYDVEFTYANGRVDTFINNAKLHLIPEVG